MDDTPQLFLRNTRVRLVEMIDKSSYNLMLRADFICIVRSALTCCGMSKNELDDALDVGCMTIPRWLAGKAMPSFERRVEIVARIRNLVEKACES